ncbi:MAG TPA: methyltransferase [Chloroflexi bacterium]|nr:methyltransferase [Chloroflexota bacterium]
MEEGDIFRRVYEVLARVPYGKVVTYGQIARHLGMPHGARVVGWALRQCPPGLPWYRVVNAQGAVSSRGGTLGEPYQRDMLEEEGVRFDEAGRIDLTIYGWDEI